MTSGLPVNRLINVDIILTPIAAQAPNLNSCLIVGSSSVINTAERIRSYGSIEEVAADFGTSAPEYLAAAVFFAQNPSPDQLYIGRWAEAGTPSILYCGTLSPAEQAIGNWQAIVDGGFKIAINGGGATPVTNLDFSGAANLNAVAAIITARLAVAGLADTCTWDGEAFNFTTTLTGNGATTSVLTAAAGGDTDISAVLKGTAGTYNTIVDGINVEEPVDALAILDAKLYWYMVTFASTTLTDDQILANAAFVEAASNKHVYGVTTTDTDAYDPDSTTDIAYLLNAGNYNRSLCQYSENAYAVASLFGRAVTVNFNGNSTVITLMYKIEPTITAESLSSTQADALEAKKCNVFVNYNNDTAIVQYGTMASGTFFDDIQNTDWLGYSIQTAVFNLLYTSATKIPQTDAGNHQIMNAIEGACVQAVANGSLAPGLWTQDGFGQLKRGDFLPKGYYIYAPPIYLQSQGDREARKSVTFQVAAKLAGAVHTVDVIVSVNR